MTLRGKNLTDLVAADFDGLVVEGVDESTHLDYKEALIGGGSDDRKKFLADICAFANAQGGDLVLGVRQTSDAKAGAVVPLSFDVDAEILRLENIISTGLDPKLFGVRVRAVPYGSGHVIVLRVPKSVSGVHRSCGDQHFYVRESRSNRQLDVPALKVRIEGELLRHTRLEEFVAQRYADIMTDNLPLPMMPGPKAVLHIFQNLTGFGEGQLDVTTVSEVSQFPVPTRPSGSDCRMTFEGPMHHSAIVNGRIRAFSLVHHVGVVEAAWKVADAGSEEMFISAEAIENYVVQFVRDAVARTTDTLGMSAPFVLRLALVGAAQGTIKSERHGRFHYDDAPLAKVRRSALVLPDVLIDKWPTTELAEMLRPTFDRLWQTSGYPRSSMYEMRGGRLQWSGKY